MSEKKRPRVLYDCSSSVQEEDEADLIASSMGALDEGTISLLRTEKDLVIDDDECLTSSVVIVDQLD